MILDSVKRGIGAGTIAGVLYGAYLGIVQTPLLQYMEHLAEHGSDHGHGSEHLLSETATVLGGIGGGVLWGLLLGAAFGVAYYLFEPGLPGGRYRPYVLAAAGFLSVSAVPWLVLPPAGPGVEQALTTETRLAIYGGMMLLGALTAALSILAYDRGTDRGGRRLGLAAGTTPLVLLFAGGLLAPTLVGGGPPPELLFAFQGTAAVGQIGLWVLIAAAYVRLPSMEQAVTAPTVSEPAE